MTDATTDTSPTHTSSTHTGVTDAGSSATPMPGPVGAVRPITEAVAEPGGTREQVWTQDGLNHLLRRQRRYADRLRSTTPAERRRMLRHFAAAVDTHRQELLDALTEDLGKPAVEGDISEVHQVQAAIAHSVLNVGRWMRTRRVPGSLSMPGTWGELRVEPKGSVLVLGPWNYPVTNLLGPFVDALAAGNTVVLKPSEKAPATAAVISRMVGEAFGPEHVAVVTGGPEVAEMLTAMPFDHILFTGNGRIGRKVLSAAAGNLTPVTLELGGKSPVVVDRSADLELTARRVVWGKFMNAGQTCVAPDHVLVPRELQDELLARLRAAVRDCYGDDPRANPDLGRVISSASVQRLQSLVDASVERGALVVLGGQCDDRYFAPTIVADVRRDMPLMGEELFGPVLPVLPYDDLDAELAAIRAGDTPLALYAFGSAAAVRHIREHTTSGGMAANGVIVHITDHRFPFGGLGASGMGAYHGEHGFRTFSHLRTVLHETPVSITRLGYPPYGPRAKVAAAFLRLTERLR